MRFFKNASKTQYKGREKPGHLEGVRPPKNVSIQTRKKKVTTESKKDEINDIWRSWNEMS